MLHAKSSSLLTATLLLLTAASAQARTKTWHCELKVGGTNYEWAACTAREIKGQDERLNRAWGKLLPLLDEKSRPDMVAEERAWVAYKERSCAFYANGEWGREGEAVHFGHCRAHVIEQRADWLEDLIDETKDR